MFTFNGTNVPVFRAVYNQQPQLFFCAPGRGSWAPGVLTGLGVRPL